MSFKKDDRYQWIIAGWTYLIEVNEGGEARVVILPQGKIICYLDGDGKPTSKPEQAQIFEIDANAMIALLDHLVWRADLRSF